MLKTLIQRVVGSRHEREARKLQPIVGEINRIAAALESLSDDELRAKTEEFRARIAERTRPLQDRVEALREEKRNSEDASDRERMSVEIGGLEKKVLGALETALDELLPEAYAVVKEACRRLVGTEAMVTDHALSWDMVPYDVQLVGAIALHDGKVAEMATGEGKTLAATMPLYLNALAGRGAHLVTVNSYLAQRDAEWMGAIYRCLGLSVGRDRPARARQPDAARSLPCRHHLRHQQRIRLRLSARQHGALARAARATRAPLRDHRRSGFDPDRRGTDPAHHLGARRTRYLHALQAIQPARAGACSTSSCE